MRKKDEREKGENWITVIDPCAELLLVGCH
jgi:hypothetical protein